MIYTPANLLSLAERNGLMDKIIEGDIALEELPAGTPIGVQFAFARLTRAQEDMEQILQWLVDEAGELVPEGPACTDKYGDCECEVCE